MEYEGHGADNIYNAEKSLEADCGHGENKMVSTDIQLLHCSGPQERHCLTGPHCTGHYLHWVGVVKCGAWRHYYLMPICVAGNYYGLAT